MFIWTDLSIRREDIYSWGKKKKKGQTSARKMKKF